MSPRTAWAWLLGLGLLAQAGPMVLAYIGEDERVAYYVSGLMALSGVAAAVAVTGAIGYATVYRCAAEEAGDAVDPWVRVAFPVLLAVSVVLLTLAHVHASLRVPLRVMLDAEWIAAHRLTVAYAAIRALGVDLVVIVLARAAPWRSRGAAADEDALFYDMLRPIGAGATLSDAPTDLPEAHTARCPHCERVLGTDYATERSASAAVSAHSRTCDEWPPREDA